MTRALEDGYADAARRRAAASPGPPGALPGPPPGRATEQVRRRRARLTVAAVLLLVGLILAMAAARTHRDAPAATRTRLALVEDVQRRTAAVDRLARTAQALAAETARLRASGLTSSAGAAAGRRLARLQLDVGAVALAGPGLEVTLDDARPATPAPLGGGGGGTPSDIEAGRIIDRDLQQVVNALWAAGAEAIAVNGQRITALSSIREAGDAILVDLRPLSPPYRVVALGDPDALPAGFAASPTAGQFRTYAQAYGLGFAVRAATRAEVPAATGLLLHAAQAPPPTQAPPSTPSTSSTPAGSTRSPGPSGSTARPSAPPKGAP
ncbi:MAG: DUF881 domain-containing protein [Frankiaceae bacterium]